jgi:hypothetical protein
VNFPGFSKKNLLFIFLEFHNRTGGNPFKKWLTGGINKGILGNFTKNQKIQ